MNNLLSRWLVGILVLTASAAFSDEIVMKNGSRIIGTLVKSTDGKVTVETDFAGELVISGDTIASIVTDTSVTLLLQDGRVFEDQNISVTQQGMVVTNEALEQVVINLEDFDKVNPAPWELGNGYRFFGEVSAALLLEGGNTENQELDFNYAVTWRSVDDRYSSRGWWEFDEANDIRNKNKWRSVNKYDRFRDHNPDNYRGVLLAVESDEFSNIDLRTYLGPYVGRTFFDTPILELEGEIGLVYVYETYEVAVFEDEDPLKGLIDDYDYPGANWGIRITSDWVSSYLGEGSTLYVDHDGIANFDNMEGLILNTIFGVGVPVWGGVKFGAELKWEYDGGVPDQVEKTDTTFNFRLGYEW